MSLKNAGALYEFQKKGERTMDTMSYCGMEIFLVKGIVTVI